MAINNGNLKLNWRVDWPAKWAIFHTTCEPAGKDHSVKGGSYDTGLEISREVFDYDGPIKLNYEWFRLGDQDMKTSKGIVFTPKKYLEIADPEILRMLILKTNPNSHISFRIEELYQLYDSYEKMESIYFNLEEASSKEEERFYKYIYPLCQIEPVLEKKPPKLSFKLITELAQYQKILKIEEIYDIANLSLKDQGYDEKIPLDKFKIQLKRAENWIKEIKIFLDEQASEDIRKDILSKIEIFEIPDKISQEIIESLNETQKEGINFLREFLESKRDFTDEQIQEKIYDISKNQLNLSRKKLYLMFQAIYLLILGKKSGPRLGPFLNKIDRDWIINRLKIE